MKLIKPGAFVTLLVMGSLLSACSVPGASTETPRPQPTATSVLAHVTNIEPPPNTPTPPEATNTSEPPAATDTDTPEPAPTATSAPQPELHLVYLDSDGATVRSINADGSAQQVITKLDKPAQGSVTYLSADPTGRYLLYGTIKTQDDYQPAFNLIDLKSGSETPAVIGPIAGLPRWSPSGDSFTAQSLKDDGTPGAIFIYSLTDARRTNLQVEGTPDFLPDDKRLVYTFKDNVYLVDPATNTSAQLTHLPNDDRNAWLVEEAHPLPGAPGIIFFGGQFKKDGEQMLGAQGNGQQWWQIPAAGGDPQPWTEPGGNYIGWYAATQASNRVAFVDSAHSSACVSVHTLDVMPSSGGSPMLPTQPDLSEQQDGAGAASVEGLSWSPDGEMLAFAARPYSCADPGAGRVTGTPVLYLWDLSTEGSVQARKVTEGLYPSWVR